MGNAHVEQPSPQRRLFSYAGITRRTLADYENQNNGEREKRCCCKKQRGEPGHEIPPVLPVGLGGHRPLGVDIVA